jgi:hypothetical protein
MEQAEAQKQKIKEIVICFKKVPFGSFFLVNHDFDNIVHSTQFNYVVPIIMLS